MDKKKSYKVIRVTDNRKDRKQQHKATIVDPLTALIKLWEYQVEKIYIPKDILPGYDIVEFICKKDKLDDKFKLPQIHFY